MTNESFTNGYSLAKEMFECRALPELVWHLEGIKMHVGLQCSDVDGELAIWQTDDDDKLQDGLKFHPYLDHNDARRVAGILMAWADWAAARAEKARPAAT
jgi:hypothetical protein